MADPVTRNPAISASNYRNAPYAAIRKIGGDIF
jgi:hypothetical protein